MLLILYVNIITNNNKHNIIINNNKELLGITFIIDTNCILLRC